MRRCDHTREKALGAPPLSMTKSGAAAELCRRGPSKIPEAIPSLLETTRNYSLSPRQCSKHPERCIAAPGVTTTVLYMLEAVCALRSAHMTCMHAVSPGADSRRAHRRKHAPERTHGISRFCRKHTGVASTGGKGIRF